MIKRYVLDSKDDKKVDGFLSRLDTGNDKIKGKVKRMLLALRDVSLAWRSES